jgi:acyl-homoserine-lactone acylase
MTRTTSRTVVRPLRAHSLYALLLLALACKPPPARSPEPRPLDEPARWAATAARVTITRDDWGVPHIAGPSDADAVFGLMYAQCEDDFARVEQNYLLALGRLA